MLKEKERGERSFLSESKHPVTGMMLAICYLLFLLNTYIFPSKVQNGEDYSYNGVFIIKKKERKRRIELSASMEDIVFFFFFSLKRTPSFSHKFRCSSFFYCCSLTSLFFFFLPRKYYL